MNARDEADKMIWFNYFRGDLLAAWFAGAREFEVAPAAFVEAQRLGITRYADMDIKPGRDK